MKIDQDKQIKASDLKIMYTLSKQMTFFKHKVWFKKDLKLVANREHLLQEHNKVRKDHFLNFLHLLHPLHNEHLRFSKLETS